MSAAAGPMLLMTPGPTRVPERVLRAGARPMIHHRSPEFSRELSSMLEMLRPVFGTRHPVLPVHTTGRGGLEAAICNLFSAGDEIVVCCNGKFGEMWAGFAESYGLIVHRTATDWSRDIDPGELARVLDDHPRVRAVAFSYCDTSTGVCNDVASLARVARSRNVLSMVDGVSAIGGMPFAFDDWDIDVAVTASQKCLMSSPGLAFVVVSERAWASSAASKLPRNYWNFRAILDETTKPKPETPGTTPVHLVLQVAESLRMIHEEGLGMVFGRHAQMSATTRAGAQRLGLSLLYPAFAKQSATVTALAVPSGVDPQALRDEIKRRGILTAAGLGVTRPHAFRIGHMGDIRSVDVERTIAAVGDALAATKSAQ